MAGTTPAYVPLSGTAAEAGQYILAVCPGRGGKRFCNELGKFCLRCQVCAFHVFPLGW